MNEWLKFEKEGHIVTLTMNRPEIRNPLGESDDVKNFEEASSLINNDRDVRCVILTGVGAAFSAGGNVKNMKEVEDQRVNKLVNKLVMNKLVNK